MKKHIDARHVDADAPEWEDEQFATAKRLNGMPVSLQAKLRGRPKSIDTKRPISLRLNADVLARWKESGAGWQTRMAAFLAKGPPRTR
jgi:uncharacterized protein (DUF4415 family)